MGLSDYNYMGSEAKNHACSNSQSQKKSVNFVWISGYQKGFQSNNAFHRLGNFLKFVHYFDLSPFERQNLLSLY